MSINAVPAGLEQERLGIEKEELRLERRRMSFELCKWFLGGLCIVISFLIVTPREQNRLDQALKLDAQKAYLSSMDTKDPELWLRKLEYLSIVAQGDEKFESFIANEKKRVIQIIDDNAKLAEAVAAKHKAEEDFKKIQIRLGEVEGKMAPGAKTSDAQVAKLKDELEILRVYRDSIYLTLAALGGVIFRQRFWLPFPWSFHPWADRPERPDSESCH
ncbi:MAG: hypothetical protein KKE73_00005, partial [Proteobacteria bacterium]|nr:hypothetical protein [Pseudomonadota bacterium]